MTIRQFSGVVAGLLLFIGLAGLTVPVSTASGTPCGSGWSATYTDPTSFTGSFTLSDEGAERCESAISTRRLWSWSLVGIGLVALAGTVLVQRSPSTRETSAG
ncbi:hypothetical protein B0I33_104511 [Prauserella shujinwangii]|uniref:Uncharacterized protein n=1 Tax=Prauserella shujinwangii TaxID=1453103 RepID=A0A2T0LXD4_9PSEU|nr:hypothetical protein [Prauserella shujinwangii]PRX48693.1 hypothetical protein B0I33_104511 [Prauserella shujinwangii]